jgi:hypothetical protein
MRESFLGTSRWQHVRVISNSTASIPYLLLLLSIVLSGCGNTARPKLPDAEQLSRTESIVKNLPPENSMRQTVLDGRYGSGNHEAWMTNMEEQGVAYALVQLRGNWLPFYGCRLKEVRKIIYRSGYEGPDAQITSAAKLDSIEKSDLAVKLRAAAFKKVRRASSSTIDSRPTIGEACFVGVHLYADEWLADDRVNSEHPGFHFFDSETFPLQSAAGLEISRG